MNAFKTNLSFAIVLIAYATNILFGAFRIIDLLKIRFQYFYLPKVISISIFSPTVDSYIWIASLIVVIIAPVLIARISQCKTPNWLFWPNLATLATLPFFFINETAATLITAPLGFLAIATTIYYGLGFSIRRSQAIGWILVLIAATIGIVETLSLFIWASNVYYYQIPFLDLNLWKFPWIDLQLFNLLYPWTAWLFVILLYTWAWIPAVRYAYNKLLHAANKSVLATLFMRIPAEEEGKLKTKTLILGIVATVATAIVVTAYAYVHLQGTSLVGVDAPYYFHWLASASKNGPLNAFQTDRPVTLIITYTIRFLTTLSPLDTAKVMPLLCAGGLSLSVFWFVRTGTRNDFLALTSALMSVFAFQTTVGMYAYFLANWIAIIFSFIMLTYVLKSLHSGKWRYMFLASFVGMLIVLTHIYTWVLAMALIGAYVGYAIVQTLRRKTTENQDIKKLASFMASNALFYTIYALLPFGNSLGDSGTKVINFVSPSFSLSAIANIYSGVASSIELWVGGLFANSLLLILAIAGMFALNVQQNKFDRILVLWVAVPSITLFTVSPENFLFHRILYLLPIQVVAAIGLQQLLLRLTAVSKGQNIRFLRVLKALVVLVVFLFLYNYALRAVEGAPLTNL